MPHVIVKLVAGRSDEQKHRMAADIAQAVMAGAGCGEAAVSVSFEDVVADRWTEEVYDPDIAGHWEKLYKKPGYGPRAAE